MLRSVQVKFFFDYFPGKDGPQTQPTFAVKKKKIYILVIFVEEVLENRIK